MNMSKKTTFVRFCFASTSMLPEELGLSTEQLICLYKECIEMAKHCNDISTMMKSCVQFVKHSNSLGRHAESLRCLKEMLPLAEAIPSFELELIFHHCLSITYKGLNEFENVVLHAKKLIEIAQTIGDKGREMYGHCEMGKAFSSLARYDDAIDCGKKCLKIAQEIDSTDDMMNAYNCIMIAHENMQKYDDTILYGEKFLDCAMKTNNQKAMMNAYLRLGNAFSSLARYDDAIDCGKKCLKIAQEIDSADAEMKAYVCIMVAHENMQKYDDTILYAHKFLDCAMKNNDQKAMTDVYLQLGRAHLALNHYQDATNFGQKCIEIAREIEDRRGEVKAYLLMGQIYNALSDYDNAIIYCKKCIELAITIGDKDAEAHAYGVLGQIYYSLEKYDHAISNCNRCLHIVKEDNEEKSADVIAYLTLGKVYQSLEKYEEAIQNYQQCIDIVNRIGLEKIRAAGACFCLGDIYERLKQCNDAVHYFKKCIDMARETGEKKIETQAWLGLSSAYQASDDKESIDNSAIQYGKKCLDIFQETDDKKSEMEGHLFLARAYMGSKQLNEASLRIDAGMAIATELGDEEAEEKFKVIGSLVYGFVGLSDKCDSPLVKELIEVPTCSEDELLQDLDEAVKTGDKSDNTEKNRALMRLYIFYSSKKYFEKAINRLEQLKEMDIHCSLNLFCFTEIGRLYHLMGQNDMAVRSFEQGLPTAESCHDNVLQSQFYHGFGQLLFSLNREPNLAEHYLREAIRCFEAIFTALGGRDEFKISIFDKYINSYKLLAILLIKGDQMEESLLVLDRCRARALKDLMMSNFKMEQEKSNDEHLEHSDVLSLVSRNDFSIAFYSICWTGILMFIEGETNLHFSIRRPNHSLQIDVDRLFKEMGVREVVDCENRSLDKEEDIQKEQRRCIEEHEGLNSSEGESNENSAKTKGSPSEALFDILECDKILSSKQDEVVIIPEGPLYKVPFPALQDRRTGKYLSETKRIRLAPSLATLKHFKDSPTGQTSNAKPLIIGDPLVGKVMMDGEECDIRRLPGALREADKISRLLGVRPLLADQATKPAVLERLRQEVSVIHIAAHGSLTKGTIALAPSPEVRATKIPEEEDYMLTMADVQQAQVRAQLVVLSCCHSGRGKIRAEGVVSMCRAFLASGARAVVASLWAIEDRATLEFMVKFYTHLMDGKRASASLQQAMNEIRNSSGYSEPEYWAPFFLMGEDVTIKCSLFLQDED